MGVMFPDKPASFLVLGPHGAGISTALDIFADFGFLTIANVDPQQLHNTIVPLSQGEKPIAFSLQIGPDTEAPGVGQAVQALQQNLADGLKILVLDAPADVLVQRYMQSDKPHPFEKAGLQQGVEDEKALFAQLKDLKDYSINTSTVTADELRHKIAKVLGKDIQNSQFTVYITTFGFKYGMPQDAELVFDMRFMDNPFYDEALRPMTGRDQPVRDFIFNLPSIPEFFEQWAGLIAMMLPMYRAQGKMRLNIAVGCTGGKHRSVCLAEALAEYLKERCPGFTVVMNHREMLRWGEPHGLATTSSACPQGESK